MSTSTRTPAQAAEAGGQGRPPATPRTRDMAAIAAKAAAASALARKGQPRAYNAKIHCGSKTHQTNEPCKQPKGLWTDHPGSGRCSLHGGSSPSGRKAAAREKVEGSLAALAIPVEGDPLEALQAAVERAHGAMLGAQTLLAKHGSMAEADLYMRTIREAARTAKAAAEAINLDELVSIREREADLLETALMRALERSGMGVRKRADFLTVFREELTAALPTGAELS